MVLGQTNHMEIRKLNLASIRRIHGKLAIVQKLCDQIEARDQQLEAVEFILTEIIGKYHPPKNLSQADLFKIETTIRVPVGVLQIAHEILGTNKVDETSQ